jgi:F-type H+-transporting ATPase subunit gamma
MELVAANKMRRSQEIALASRAYGFAALELLGTLSRLDDVKLPALLQQRPVAKRAVVVITSDKGLAGAFNSAVLREFENFLADSGIDPQDAATSFIGVGQKAVNYLERRTRGLTAKFVRFGDYTTLEEISPLSERLVSGFLAGEWDEVKVLSMHFKSALSQEVVTRTLLPVDPQALQQTLQEVVPATGRFADIFRSEEHAKAKEDKGAVGYKIEPQAEAVLDLLVPHLVRTEIYQLVLEANASEWAARRFAMKNASDNAKDLGDALTLEFNKSRQAAITREIMEITAGAEALK